MGQASQQFDSWSGPCGVIAAGFNSLCTKNGKYNRCFTPGVGLLLSLAPGVGLQLQLKCVTVNG
jgi:hypothetical protein